jgi:hypothetical protein
MKCSAISGHYRNAANFESAGALPEEAQYPLSHTSEAIERTICYRDIGHATLVAPRSLSNFV